MRISDWSSDVCSSDLWKVETLSGPIVVKRPLPQLRVAAEWGAPGESGTSEVRWLRRARGVDPAIAPEVLAELPGHAFAMRFLPGCPVWKDELIDRKSTRLNSSH